MKYTYQNMQDKSIEGVCKEVSKGLAIAAFYLVTTVGMPKGLFKEKILELNDAEKLLWYMNFRNKNPKLFKSNRLKQAN